MTASHPDQPGQALRLSALARGDTARVLAVEDRGGDDPVARRLQDLGFVAGEPVRVVALGPLGGDPLVVQVGYTRFALRRREAGRVLVAREAGAAA